MASIVRLYEKPLVSGVLKQYQTPSPVLETHTFLDPKSATKFADHARLERGMKAVVLHGMPC